MINAALAEEPLPPVPYTLSDMAGDAVGLLDHLGIERAHVMGVSMGGMIAQTVAIEHPERVASLISIMSMTGEPEYGAPTPEAMAVLMSPPPADRAEAIRRAADIAVFSSKRYFDLARAEEHDRPAPSTAASTPRARPASWRPSTRRARAATRCRRSRRRPSSSTGSTTR